MPYLYIPTAYISISFYAVYAKVIGSVRGSEQQQQRYILSTRTSLSCVYRNRTRLAWRQNDNVQATERALKGRRWINLLLFSFFLWLCLYIFHPGIVWPIYIIYLYFFFYVCVYIMFCIFLRRIPSLSLYFPFLCLAENWNVFFSFCCVPFFLYIGLNTAPQKKKAERFPSGSISFFVILAHRTAPASGGSRETCT